MGPSTKRLNPASQPTLTQPGLDLLGSIFGGGGAPQGGNTFRQFVGQGFLHRNVNPLAAPPQMAPGGDVLSRMEGVFGSPIKGGFDQFGGEATVKAYQPLFQRNLADAIAAQRESGPRFSSGQDLLGMQTSQRALQDFNAFAQNVLQQGQQTKLQAMLGAGQQQGQLLQQLLGALFTGGGINAAPIYQQTPGFGQQLLGLAGTIGGGIAGAGGFNPLFGGGGGPASYSGNPYSPFGG